MSDNCPVRAPPLPLHTPGEVKALIFPDLHRTKNGHGHDASGAPSTATTSTTRESTASSFTTPNPSSRTSSAEPTESPTTSSTEPPFSPPSALVPRSSSPIPIPARLRRKCPMYAQQFVEGEKEKEDYGDAFATSAAGKKKVVVVVIGATKNTEPARTSEEKEEEEEEEEEDARPTAGAAATAGRLSPVVPSPESPIECRATPRKRIVTPVVPVPHLIKKSRGRRVPEPDQARERTHVCAVPGCSKSFARAEHLKRHVISLHTHEKPFVCRCGKTFARRDNLLQHQRVHAT